MADEKQVAEATPETEGPAKRKINVKAIALIGGFVTLQAVLTLVIVWAVRGASGAGPQAVQAAPDTADIGPAEADLVLLQALPNDSENKIVAVNAQRGRLVYWALKVSLRVPRGQEVALKERLIANEDLIRDKISTVVGKCDPVILEQEADHATLKRQIRFALNSVLGKGAVSEVVIPQCIPQMVE
jgi:flagellar basal body-associated protein FliL